MGDKSPKNTQKLKANKGDKKPPAKPAGGPTGASKK